MQQTLEETTDVQGKAEVTQDEASDIFSIQGETAVPLEFGEQGFMIASQKEIEKEDKKKKASEEKIRKAAEEKARADGTGGSQLTGKVDIGAKARSYMELCLGETAEGDQVFLATLLSYMQIEP
jgi:hypothetical protein